MLIRPNAPADASAVHGCLAPPERPALLTQSGHTSGLRQCRRPNFPTPAMSTPPPVVRRIEGEPNRTVQTAERHRKIARSCSLPSSGVSRPSTTPRGHPSKRSDFSGDLPCRPRRRELSESRTRRPDVVRSSFLIVRDPQPPNRYDVTDSRHFQNFILTDPCSTQAEIRLLPTPELPDFAQARPVPTSYRALLPLERAHATPRAAARRGRPLAVAAKSSIPREIASLGPWSASWAFGIAGSRRRTVPYTHRSERGQRGGLHPGADCRSGRPQSRHFLHFACTARCAVGV